jgi:hypothetical protein
MKHTIISWDCSFRNFFHLIDALLVQDYSHGDFELIYVEQRERQVADEFNDQLGLKSLWDRYEEVREKLQIKVIYLGKDLREPYHLGKCNNEGLRIAKGEIISVMDGDQLLPRDFLTKLDECHWRNSRAVVNIHRKSAIYPVGVKNFKDWPNAIIDYKECLKACPDRFTKMSKRVNNMGPMISARREFWHAIGGYDESQIWGTVLSKSGLDVNTRLEIATGSSSEALLDVFAVHPWHPIGGGSLRTDEQTKCFFALQEVLINWSKDNNEISINKRTPVARNLEKENRVFISKMMDVQAGEIEDLDIYNLSAAKWVCKFNHIKNIFRRAVQWQF